MEFEPLKGWENFYVITGSAAAGLTGLTFVVIALVRDARRVNAAGFGAFVSPTIVHFSAVLGLAAFMVVPRLAPYELRIGLGVIGAAGILYVGRITHTLVHRVPDYRPVLEDWAFNVLLPAAAYGTLLAMGVLLGRHPRSALEGVAGACLLLLLIGIHNAWDIAVWMSVKQVEDARGAGSGEGG